MRFLALLLIIGTLGGLVIAAPTASAHVLIRDESGKKGAILHLAPDDDPIAGKKATLYFDAQDVFATDSKVTLSVTQVGSGEAASVAATRDGTLVTADYVFPSQGVYKLQYKIRSGVTTYVFTQSTRIARGVALGDVEKPSHTWAEGLLFGAGVSLLALAVIAFNYRRDIATHSTF